MLCRVRRIAALVQDIRLPRRDEGQCADSQEEDVEEEVERERAEVEEVRYYPPELYSDIHSNEMQ